MGAETVGWLQGIIDKHAKVFQSMCQQHAGSRCLARIEMFKGLGEGEGALVPNLFLRQNSLSGAQQRFHQVWGVWGGGRHKCLLLLIGL